MQRILEDGFRPVWAKRPNRVSTCQTDIIILVCARRVLERIHSSLGYLTPVEFEAQWASSRSHFDPA